MRVTRKEAERNRERVREVAARLFRERGFDGIGVAEVMKHAGLTHGGFYGQFESKEDLMAEASTWALDDNLASYRTMAAKAPQQPVMAIAAELLSARHRRDFANGCALAALGADASRQGRAVRRKFTQGISALIDLLRDLVPGKSVAQRREKALAVYVGVVGAVVLARAVHDPRLAEEIFQATMSSISKQIQ